MKNTLHKIIRIHKINLNLEVPRIMVEFRLMSEYRSTSGPGVAGIDPQATE